MNKRTYCYGAALALLAATLVGGTVCAQSYPNKPIRLVVPYAPGGVADLMSRIVAQKLGAFYSQQIVVDNRAGSGGHIGAELVVKAPADGYTIMFGTTTHNAAYAISVASKVPQDIVRRLNADLDTVIKLPELASRWTELGITLLGGSPEAAVKRNTVETEVWTRVIKAAGIRAD